MVDNSYWNWAADLILSKELWIIFQLAVVN
jgi:hypothetical protein